MKRIRKAIGGGLSAGIAAAAGGFVFTGAPTREQVGQFIGLFVGGFFVGFVGVYSSPENEQAAKQNA